MSYRNFLILSLVWIIAIYATIPSVSAVPKCEVLYQGDEVFLGEENCDLSRVISWQTTFAYYNSGYPGGIPDREVEVSGFMHNVYIDPAVYCVGTWYKYDFGDDDAGNMLAFVVKSGVRPEVYTNETPAPGTTPIIPTPPAKNIPKETHLYIARGDHGTLSYALDWNKTLQNTPMNGTIWLFGTSSSLTQVLDEPMVYNSNDTVNTYTISPEKSDTLTPGFYTGYIQFAGANGIKDVWYSQSHKIDDYRYNILETPYDDAVVPDVPLEGYVPSRVQEEFEKLAKSSRYSDDVLIPITMEVADPELTITNYWEELDFIVIQGTTNLEAGTPITIWIDPDQYPLPADKRAHTFNTTAIKETTTGYLLTVDDHKYIDEDGNPVLQARSSPRTFKISIPLLWGELGIGEHSVVAEVTKYNIDVTTTKIFAISGTWVNPTPVPEFKKVIVSEGGTHAVSLDNKTVFDSSGFPNGSVQPTIQAGTWDIDVNGNPVMRTTYPVVTLPPTPTLPPVNETLHPNVNTTARNNTRPITVATTIPTRTPIPVPTDDVTIPVSPVLALMGIAVVVLVKGRRR
jgi:hypothetical protein